MTMQNYSQEQIEKMAKAATQQAEEMANISKAGFEAWMKSANIFMDNTQNMFKTITKMTNSARETQAAAMKQFMSCKTLNDMTETSTKVAQQTMEQSMSQATELAEKTIKSCMDTIEPISEQMSKGLQTTMKTAQKASKAA
jgi:hypothetical protein